MNQLSKTLKQLRTQRGLGQKELAAALHCSVPAVSTYETGRHEPDLDTLIDIARFYGVSVDYLLGLSDVPDPADKPRLICKGYSLSRFLRLLDKLSTLDRAFLGYGLRLLERVAHEPK